MRKRDDFEDDGRTIADMSGIGPAPTLRPHRRKADAPPPEPANDRPWEQAPDWTPKEKFWAVMGVLELLIKLHAHLRTNVFTNRIRVCQRLCNTCVDTNRPIVGKFGTRKCILCTGTHK